MKKRVCTIFLVALLGISTVLGGCVKNSKSTSGSSSDTTIHLLNGKSEVDAQLQTLAAAYEKETGIQVVVESIAAGVDAQATLKGYYLSNQLPDIFVCEGASFENWEGLLVDMSDQEWAKKTEAAYVDSEYGTIGFPYTIEAIGLAYNADILAKAGIDPTKLTSLSAYQEAFAKLDSMKGELGLTAVSGYCAESENLGWSSGNHIFGAYLDSGLDREDTTYIDLLNDGGQIDVNRFQDYANLIGLLQQYADPALLVNGTYEEQVRGFASGKYAFVTQGSWIGASLMGDYASEYQSAGNFEIGMAPYAFEDGQDTILTSAPSWWAVAKEGNVTESEKFLAWCASDAGQKILVEEAGFVSPFTDCAYVAEDPFAQTISDHIAAQKTSNWHWQNFKEGLGQDALAPLFQAYASGTYDSGSFTQAISQAAAEYYAKE